MGIPKRRNTSSLFSHSHQHFWHQMCHQPLLQLPGKSTLNIRWKNWCWSSNIWPPDVESRLTGKDPDAGKEWRQEEKGMTEDEMVGWHHRLNGPEFEKTLGDREGWGGLVFCVHVVTKSRTWLNAWVKLDTKWVSCSAVLTLTPCRNHWPQRLRAQYTRLPRLQMSVARYPYFCLILLQAEVPTTPSPGSITCSNSSQNSERCVPVWLLQDTDEQIEEEVPRARSEGSQVRELLSPCS